MGRRCCLSSDQFSKRSPLLFMQYYREHAHRSSFYANLVAAAFQEEVSRLRDTSAALLLAQQSTFSPGLARLRAFQCIASVLCINVQVYALSPQDLDGVSGTGSAVLLSACHMQLCCFVLRTRLPRCTSCAKSMLHSSRSTRKTRISNSYTERGF
jgi:hypothetical protein